MVQLHVLPYLHILPRLLFCLYIRPTRNVREAIELCLVA